VHLLPGPHWEIIQLSPDAQLNLSGPLRSEEKGGGKRREWEGQGQKKEGKEEKMGTPPPFGHFLRRCDVSLQFCRRIYCKYTVNIMTNLLTYLLTYLLSACFRSFNQLNSTQVYYNLVVDRPNSARNHGSLNHNEHWSVHEIKYNKHKKIHSDTHKGKSQKPTVCSAWLSVGVWRCIQYACVGWVLELIKENTKIVTHYYNNTPTSSSDRNKDDKTSSDQQLVI